MPIKADSVSVESCKTETFTKVDLSKNLRKAVA
jgi:hypothetical protein